MVLRLALTLALLLAHLGGCGWPASQVGPAVAQPRVRVDTVETEDAYATQCRAGVCATLQVTRSRFSHGAVSTLLFFSAYDAQGRPVQIPGFPSGFTGIASEHFVMSREGTRATLTYSGVSVTWQANGRPRKRAENGSARSRVSEREQQVSANVTGAVGPIVFGPAGPGRPGDYASAFLTVRQTVSRTRVRVK
jgi:hypothetical protein